MDGIQTHLSTNPTHIASIFPLLLPDNPSLSSYSGFIEVKGEHFKLQISLPEPARDINPLPPSTLNGASISCCNKLKSILTGSEDVIKKRLAQSSSLGAFCIEFKLIVEEALLRSHSASTRGGPSMKLLPSSYYSRLMEELNEIGWHQVQAINNEFSQICLVVCDSHKRNHQLEVTLPADYPTSSPTCRASLPVPFLPKWIAGQSMLTDLISQFQAQLQSFQSIWKVLDDFDENAVVIEPINPTRADLQRRISISKFGSLRIDFSLLNPLGIPVYSFMGAESTIRPLRDLIAQKIHHWDYNKTPRENFEFLLGIQFPRPDPASSDQDSNQQEPCAICYAFLLDEKIPDQVCDNTSCAKIFHSKCIFDWLQSIAATHRGSTSSHVIWGSCPYCEHKMSIKNPAYQ